MSSPFAYQATTTAAVERTYLRQVFAWMLLGLALTTGVAIYLTSTSNVADYFNQHSGAF
jgi:FtsH-binding integral membrane protein